MEKRCVIRGVISKRKKKKNSFRLGHLLESKGLARVLSCTLSLPIGGGGGWGW